jgi:hypothetical protein
MGLVDQISPCLSFPSGSCASQARCYCVAGLCDERVFLAAQASISLLLQVECAGRTGSLAVVRIGASTVVGARRVRIRRLALAWWARLAGRASARNEFAPCS